MPESDSGLRWVNVPYFHVAEDLFHLSGGNRSLQAGMTTLMEFRPVRLSVVACPLRSTYAGSDRSDPSAVAGMPMPPECVRLISADARPASSRRQRLALFHRSEQRLTSV